MIAPKMKEWAEKEKERVESNLKLKETAKVNSEKFAED